VSSEQLGAWRNGTKMQKVKGYSFNGVIVASFLTTKRELRYVCELEGVNGAGMLHIFSHSQIEPRGEQ